MNKPKTNPGKSGEEGKSLMKSLLFSALMGLAVGLLYAAVRVKSPAPPFVALVGLLGMVIGEQALPWIRTHLFHTIR